MQLDLLRAALLTGTRSLEAWRRWQARADVDSVDAGTQRLLPLLAHNLHGQGIAGEDVARFKGLLRYAWAANQRRTNELAAVVIAFADAGIPTMLLKGMALLQGYYDNAGLRPMDDVDLLVPIARAHDAMATLVEGGWRPLGPDVDPTLTHARSYRHPSGGQLDLHWRAQWEFGDADADDVWAHARAVPFAGRQIRTLSGADLLLQVIVHGCRWNFVPPLRWVADALVVVRSPRPLGWDRVVSQASTHGLVLPLRQALDFLVAEFDAPVPEHVCAALASHRPTVFERVEQRMREWTSPAVGCFPLVLCHHVRLTRRHGALATFWRLPRYLQHTYQLPSLRSLPGELCTRAAQRLRAAAM